MTHHHPKHPEHKAGDSTVAIYVCLFAAALFALMVWQGIDFHRKHPRPVELPPVIVATPAPELPKVEELRPSIDVPPVQETTSAPEDVPPEAAPAPEQRADLQADAGPAAEVASPGDDQVRDHRAVERRVHSRHRGRHGHYVGSRRKACEPLCEFFKATAHVAGMI